MPTVLFLLISTPVLAEETFIWKIHGWYVIDFLVALAIVIYYGAPAIKKFFKERAQSIQQALQEAERRMQEAESRLREYETRLKNVQKEMEELIARYRERGEQERKALLHEAHIRIKALERQAEARIELAQSEIEARVKRLVIEETISQIEKEIRAKGGLAPSTRLVDTFEREVRSL